MTPAIAAAPGLPVSRFKKLLNRRIDRDTRILTLRITIVRGNIPVLLETWDFDGILGASAVFLSTDVAALTDDDLVDLLVKDLEETVASETTISRRAEYTYLNYRFEAH